ncbi:Protein of unknown function [Lactobacillus acidophilus DSM 20079 = JCM 1132 = NBRC 13951 = CIP 76.13]|nr:Protein of unknown function [Lactobacillus acidophilus DSM 20079 = JCM 1132 = NBRC 13951 = CIP 76.13]CDF71294.1 Protein of unknown function [Lactobacillus acidophilus CIRM-BIA 445]CDF75112.1 Protein of unknown function [Lactobacillus acidophilus DSM 20242]
MLKLAANNQIVNVCCQCCQLSLLCRKFSIPYFNN